MPENKKQKYNLDWIKKYSTQEFEDEYTYEGKDLGADWTSEGTWFRLWSPFADMVKVNLYQTGDSRRNDLIYSASMDKKEKGVWALYINENLDGVYYTFTARFGEEENEFCDPYAKACGVNGVRAMVVNLSDTNPVNWDKDTNPNEKLPICKSVIYELHVRDFSSDSFSGIDNKRKFLGLSEKNTTVGSKGNIATGIDYVKELGITHIHLLPFYDYATIDEAAEYSGDKYNWGYDPLNYNVPEGSYSTNPFEGKIRIRELKQTIKELHENGISVIMDVVYNHTFNEDFCFNKAVPGYFHRIDMKGELSDGSACGNDTASERSMVSKFIVDSVLYWAEEYHLDGFRFDLVGLIDVDTINKIRIGLDKIRPNIIMYGEGWTLDTVLTKENVRLSTQQNIGYLNGFAMFSDDIRDIIKGSVFEEEEQGFISGNTKRVEELKLSILGIPKWSDSPKKVINYTSCHDNYTLFDKIHLCNTNISFEDAVRQNLLAISIVMLSQGIPLMHAGEEILRTKKDKNGKYVSDSVREADSVNSIKWQMLEDERYYAVYQYYKGLIAFRKKHDLLTLENKEEVLEKIDFIETNNDNVIAYRLKDDKEEIVVIFNSSDETVKLKIGRETDEYDIFINEQKAGIESMEKCGNIVEISPISCKVMLRAD